MKFARIVGFEFHSEDVPGVFKSTIVEKFYRGNVEQEVRRLYPSDKTINNDINVDDRIKIVADPFAQTNYQQIRFVEHLGACWTVKTVDVRNYPSMLLYLGGVYNGERQPKADETT